MDKRKIRRHPSRREFGLLSAAALATPLIGFGSQGSPTSSATAEPQVTRKPTGRSGQGFNIVFLFGDQERYFAKWPKGLSLPAHKRLQRTGVTFGGRYKFSRYFAPVDRNKPANLVDLYKSNDVELFDLQTEPLETTN